MGKVRRIDWSPDEFIAGTFGVLTGWETAVYIVALNFIYSRDRCPNDARHIHAAFSREPSPDRHYGWSLSVTDKALAGLIAKGKLHVSPDGQWLTNGRAEVELNKARDRIGGAVRAGIASGVSRSKRGEFAGSLRGDRGSFRGPVSSNANGLARTGVRNHQPPKIHESESDRSTTPDAAREPAPDLGAPARAPAKSEPEAQAARPISAEAQSQRDRLAEITAAKRAAFLKGQK
jgi:hypothetical protein